MTWENSDESPGAGPVIMTMWECNDLLLDMNVNTSCGHRPLQREFIHHALPQMNDNRISMWYLGDGSTQSFWYGNWKERGHLKGLDLDGY